MGLILRRLGGLGFVLVLFLGALAINLWLVLEHYLAAYSALTLLRTEGWQIGDDGLLGPFLGALVPEATLPQALALTLSAGIWLLFVLVAHELMQLVERTRDLVESRAAGDQAGVQAARWQIGAQLLMLAFVVTGMVLAVRWDMELFVFRTLGSASGSEGAADAPWMVHPTRMDPSAQSAFALILSRVGAWGYLGVTAACAVALELLARRVGDATELLGMAWDRLWEGADQDDEPEDDDVAEEELEEEASAEDGAADEPAEIAPTAAPEVPAPVRSDPLPAATPEAPRPVQEPAIVDTPVEPLRETPAAPAPLFPAERPSRNAGARPAAPPVVAPAPPAADLREVIGGVAGERVGIAEALADNDRYHVDPATGSIWRRDHWGALHGEPTDSDEENAA